MVSVALFEGMLAEPGGAVVVVDTYMAGEVAGVDGDLADVQFHFAVDVFQAGRKIGRALNLAFIPAGPAIYSVQIGERIFTCLRVIQLEGEITDEQSPLDVNYVTREGRTVLKRSYCQDCFDNIDVDRDEKMVVDGVSLFLWEDTLTGLAIGI